MTNRGLLKVRTASKLEVDIIAPGAGFMSTSRSWALAGVGISNNANKAVMVIFDFIL
jgi:hypothetical protein